MIFNDLIELIAEIIAGFLFWAIATDTPAALWHYPLNEETFTGWEACFFLFWGFFVLTAGFESVRRLTTRYRFVFLLLSCVSFFSISLPQRPDLRILLLCLGLGFGFLMLMGPALHADSATRSKIWFGASVGGVVFSITRLAFFSLNPLFESRAFLRIFVPQLLIPLAIFFNQRHRADIIVSPTSSKTAWIPAGLAVGSYFFMELNYMTNSGTICRYANLSPFPCGISVILFQLLGIFFGFHQQFFFLSSPLLRMLMCLVGWFFFVAFPGTFADSVKLFGGLILAFSIKNSGFDVWTHLKNSQKPLLSAITGGFFALFLIVWIVPLGFILRERHISMLFVSIFSLYLPSFFSIKSKKNSTSTNTNSDSTNTNLNLNTNSNLNLNTNSNLNLNTNSNLNLNTNSNSNLNTNSNSNLNTTKTNYVLSSKSSVILYLLVIAGVLFPISSWRFHWRSLPPEGGLPSTIIPLVWAIHFGYDDNGNMNLDRSIHSRFLLNRANILSLVETDSQRAVMGSRDVVEYLAESLHFDSDYGPGPETNNWGCALLSVFPIVRVERVILPSPDGELACLIDADVLVNGTRVRVLSTHFGNEEEIQDLEEQALALGSRIQENDSTPTLLLGYLTNPPYTRRWFNVVKNGLKDSCESHERWCLYVLYKDLYLIPNSFRRIPQGQDSDTESQIAHFLIDRPTPPLPESLCFSISSNVQCQSEPFCSWCSLENFGQCYPASYFEICKEFGGFWIGPKQNSSEISLKLDSLIDFVESQDRLHLSQSLSWIDGSSQSHRWIWNMDNFGDVITWVRRIWSSPLFYDFDSFWRLDFQRLRAKNEWYIQFNLTRILPLQMQKNLQAPVTISVATHFRSQTQQAKDLFNNLENLTFAQHLESRQLLMVPRSRLFSYLQNPLRSKGRPFRLAFQIDFK